MKSYKEILIVILSIIFFGIAHYNLTKYTNILVQDLESFEKWQNWLILFAYSLYFISGLISSLVSKLNPLLVSGVTGFGCAILAIVVFGVGGDIIGLVLMLTLGSLCGMLGGLVVLIFTKMNQNPLTNRSSLPVEKHGLDAAHKTRSAP